MVEFINESVGVEAHTRPDGTIRPQAFWRDGHRFEITSWGREEQREREGQALHCYLVQTDGSQTWELCRKLDTSHWILTRRWGGRQQIV
jgi:hypothetical protein